MLKLLTAGLNFKIKNKSYGPFYLIWTCGHDEGKENGGCDCQKLWTTRMGQVSCITRRLIVTLMSLDPFYVEDAPPTISVHVWCFGYVSISGCLFFMGIRGTVSLWSGYTHAVFVSQAADAITSLSALFFFPLYPFTDL